MFLLVITRRFVCDKFPTILGLKKWSESSLRAVLFQSAIVWEESLFSSDKSSISPTYRFRRVTFYDMPTCHLQSPSDSSQPIAVLSPTFMRSVAVFKRILGLCEWCETSRSPSQCDGSPVAGLHLYIDGSITRRFRGHRAKLSAIELMRICCELARHYEWST